MKRRCGTLLLVLSLLAGSLYAKTLYVDDNAPGDPGPGDTKISDPNEDGSADHPFDSIQEAIDAASSMPPYSSVWPRVGDTIIVAPGHYLASDPWQYDEINFKDKAIRLISSAPTDFSVAERTVLCGVVVFKGFEGSTCLLQGFKIQSIAHGGILGNGTDAAISHCILSGNGPCGGTVLKDVHGRISNCLIVDNKTVWRCGVTPVISGCTQFFNCTIANNASSVSLARDNTMGDTPIKVHNCIIYENANGNQQILESLPSRGVPSLESQIDHCLIQGWYAHASAPPALWTTNFEGDPCFVQPGRWEGDTLIEGDYHLKSEGFRWIERPKHASHWDVDFETSCAIDAGDPMDLLGDEPERGPDDPNGLYGVNHAIDCGAYGGTSQASLAPTGTTRWVSPDGIYYRDWGPPLGVGGVDLRDYLPLAVGNSWSRTTATESIQSVIVTGRLKYRGQEIYMLADTSPLGGRRLACGFIDYVLYTIQDPASEARQPVHAEPNEARYPRILTVGSTIEAPVDLFAPETSPRRPALVLRGALADVLAGTKFDPNQFASVKQAVTTSSMTFNPSEPLDLGDVIAVREKMADGAAGEPIALFARGIGPLLLDGEPVTNIQVGRVIVTRETTGSSTSTAQSP